MTLEEFRELVRRRGLERFADRIEQALQPSVRAVPSPGNTDVPGFSRLGGAPDVPAGFQWPVWNGAPLRFIAQLNLAEVAIHDVRGNLPRSGLLSFFYEGAGRVWHTRTKDQDAAQVVYSPAGARLHQVASPAEMPAQSTFSSCSLSFAPEWSLGASCPWLEDDEEFSDAEFDAYDDLLSDLASANGGRQPLHRIGGTPDQVQDPVLDPEDELLFQVDSDNATGMMWCDAGIIYYVINRHQLLHRKFDGAWLELQTS